MKFDSMYNIIFGRFTLSPILFFFSTFDENSDSKNSQATISNRIFDLTLERPKSFFYRFKTTAIFFEEDTYKITAIFLKMHIYPPLVYSSMIHISKKYPA
ncbi:hypothetical protein WUBG_19237 [Wuchereria bancrofti]|uniref:Uncharacterized protein n=1 Tax=Wuchereria bancrofti TaxID=6293 RepID=J9E381_WUCBA|nr:hypothetical protein WUBG_19237 [Wuchereria bancrofti]